MNPVTIHINALVPLSPETEHALTDCLTPCRFPRRHLLVEEGHRAGAAFFIERGITRSYWLVNGEEITTSFAAEGSIVFSMDELYYDKPSEKYVETLEETEAYKITLDDLRRLFRTNLELANWGRIIHQNEYRRLHRSHKEPPAPLAQGTPHPARCRTLHGLLPAVSRRGATGAAGLHRVVSGDYPAYAEPIEGKEISGLFCRRTNARRQKLRTFAPLNN